MSDATATPEFELLEDGRIVNNRRGKQTLLATYDQDTGHIEYESKEISAKHGQRISVLIGTIGDGRQVSERKIKEISIKGEKRDVVKPNTPPAPKRNKLLGEDDPIWNAWELKYKPQQFYARFGVLVDNEGEPRRATVKRMIPVIRDDRNTADDNNLEKIQQGAKTWSTGAINYEMQVVTLDNQLIGSRKCSLVFTKDEMVGENTITDGDDDL